MSQAIPQQPDSALNQISSALDMRDYDLLRRIGRGSYGEVWLARNVTGAFRAIKVVHRHTFSDDRPFDREFTGIKKFEPVSRSQENLVQILHVGRHSSAGCFYYVMELADDVSSGASIDAEIYQPHTLSAAMARRGRLSFQETLRAGIALTTALSHLHRHGLIHRDVKPSNIIFVQGIPKLADIGLVAEAGESRSFVGTEGFVPPEGPGTPQADLFSLGKVLYEACTGFDRQQFPRLPADWPDAPEHRALMELNEIILKACEPEPARRYSAAEAMLADLAMLQSGKSVRRARLLELRLARVTHLAAVAGIMMLLSIGALVIVDRRAQESERQRHHESVLRRRAQEAEKASREQLGQSLLASARAERRSGRTGQRFTTLSHVTNAVQLLGGYANLRTEAVAALALPDLRQAESLRHQRPGAKEVRVYPGVNRVVYTLANGLFQFARLHDDADLMSFQDEDRGRLRIPGFSPDGNVFHALFENGETWLWHIDNSVRRVKLPANIAVRQFTADSRHMAATRMNGRLTLFDVNTGDIWRDFPIAAPVSDLWTIRNSPFLAAVTRRAPGGQP
ncbi:MAG: serine/threonine-protein kinase, partial [Verrucomicrobiota bacterium]